MNKGHFSRAEGLDLSKSRNIEGDSMDSAVHRSSKGPKEMKEFRTGHWDLKNNLKLRFCL